MKQRILLVEDEVMIAKAIANFLHKEGYEVVQAHDGEAAMQQLHSFSFDLMLLDLMLPKKSGEEVLKETRVFSDIPIIVISALSDELIQLDAFEQQIDDYVVKPFSMNILTYKIKAILRRMAHQDDSWIHYQSLSLQVDNYIVLYDKEEISLTTKEFEILQLLILNQGRVYSRDEILTLVWGYDYYGDARNIDVHIKNLRKKLPISIITTVKGIGYRVHKEQQ